ncbi:MAG: DUF134 domain-containing protein [Planctomycetota bacterium]
MSRPKCCRTVSEPPACCRFKPVGVPASSLDEVVLTVDEWEAIRLADFEGLYQEKAADRMNVSRQTFGRILELGRKKVAQALVQGKVLLIKGGDVEMAEMRTFKCCQCDFVWGVPRGTGRPKECPTCHGDNIRRAEEERGRGSRGRGRHGRCCRHKQTQE